MEKPQTKLPKDALSKIDLGQSFAEYDLIQKNSYVFVRTPAMNVALDSSNSKQFFVGRRGTGKTAINYYLMSVEKNSIQLIPQIFDIIKLPLALSQFKDTKQRPFKSLVTCFERALLDEVIGKLINLNLIRFSEKLPAINKERNLIEDFDFDLRMIKFVEDIFEAYEKQNDKEWLRQIKRPNEIIGELGGLLNNQKLKFNILIDRIDESWDGSDEAVILLTSLMHACIQCYASTTHIRPYLFLRENIFERVRQIDNEFARLETAVVPLDWTKELLLEMIERRLNLPFYSKLPLGGPTWSYFFDSPSNLDSQSMIYSYCQDRPRDILTYCGFAVESAQSHKHDKILIEDIQQARRRFSDSRLKDLGDEYAENYPQIQLVLGRFYGLGTEYTISGVEAFIKKLLTDKEIEQLCGSWIYSYTSPDLFIEMLYNIGFVGIKDKETVHFRSLGPRSSTPPPISHSNHVCVHPSYHDALNLRGEVIVSLDEETPLQKAGILVEFPEGTTWLTYIQRLKSVQEDLRTLPNGKTDASKFEDIVGEILRLCFFRCLVNIQPKQREIDGCVIRDWIAANRATKGFWHMIRGRYQATQIVWECKNYDELSADDFHQVSYYMNQEIGYFSVLVFRGDEIKKSYFQHIKRIAHDKKGGILLLLCERDLNVFIRQAINGKSKEDHIHEVYDSTIRAIS